MSENEIAGLVQAARHSDGVGALVHGWRQDRSPYGSTERSFRWEACGAEWKQACREEGAAVLNRLLAALGTEQQPEQEISG